MNASAPAADAASNGTSSRRRRLWLLAAVVIAVSVGVAAYWYLHSRWYESTDDAYVGGRIVQITAEIPGTIRTIFPQETDSVVAGQPLVELDPVDARVAFDTAVADLAATVRQVRSEFVQVSRARAQVRAREVELARLKSDLARRTPLAGGGAVSAEEIAHLRESVDGAEAARVAAQEELNVALAHTQGTTVETHPLVERSAMRVRDAALSLKRTTIVAPVTGVVGRKGVQVGQRVAPGAPLMSVVPLEEVWVDANFKEVQLEQMRIGQPVTLRADLYGRSVDYHGRVQGFSPGTGAAFALLPAQNASGNWIKIVQRVPVRVALDAAEVHEHPLRIGLSMRVEVDLHDQSGPVLATPATTVSGTMPSHAERDPEVEATIARIIAENAA